MWIQVQFAVIYWLSSSLPGLILIADCKWLSILHFCFFFQLWYSRFPSWIAHSQPPYFSAVEFMLYKSVMQMKPTHATITSPNPIMIFSFCFSHPHTNTQTLQRIVIIFVEWDQFHWSIGEFEYFIFRSFFLVLVCKGKGSCHRREGLRCNMDYQHLQLV